MNTIYHKYLPQEEIPVFDYVSKRKLVKYYTRDTMAALVCMGQLFKEKRPSPETPFFFSTGENEMMDIYKEVCRTFAEKKIEFTPPQFIEKGIPTISPVSNFKMMRNMAHCFISIEYGLKGDNAALLGSISGLLTSALLSEGDGPIIVGASKLHADNTAEAGISLLTSREVEGHPMLNSQEESISFFRKHKKSQK
jgi:hypothetical protein